MATDLAQIEAKMQRGERLSTDEQERRLAAIKRDERLAEIDAKHTRGERLSHDEWKLMVEDESRRVSRQILDAFDERRANPERQHAVLYSQAEHNAMREAIKDAVWHTGAYRLLVLKEQDALADRIAALEAAIMPAIKPRARIAAPSRRAA